MTNIADLSQQQWDVVIVGSGIGGATAGYTLVNKNLNVLLLEKGPEVTAKTSEQPPDHPDERLAQGWWPQQVSHQTSKNHFDRFYASIGCGVGGTSMHYAAALERLHPKDFESYHAGDTHIDAWPISYEEFASYYAEAEALYGLNDDTENGWQKRISEWDHAFIKHLRESGLKPEKLNVAIKYLDGCEECIGRTCIRDCKQDARNACLNKISTRKNYSIIKNCEVKRLIANKSHIDQVECVIDGETLIFKANTVILAAGALHTPLILLRSANAHWPNGLANQSGLVGKNLMFHGGSIYSIWAPRRYNRQAIQKKSISIKDFYYYDGKPLGFVQSLGLSAGYGVISMYIKDILSKLGIKNKLLQSLIANIPAKIAAKLFGEASIFASQVEDFPDEKNLVALSDQEPNKSYFSYTITHDLRNRAKELKQNLASHLNGWRLISITQGVYFNSGHACGTCKFGNDPTKSVLDVNCKAHDVDNLYIADSSFMPRSGSANPSLTIAANAIRVAEHIYKNTSNQ